LFWPLLLFIGIGSALLHTNSSWELFFLSSIVVVWTS
jgi:hypothetical protein